MEENEGRKKYINEMMIDDLSLTDKYSNDAISESLDKYLSLKFKIDYNDLLKKNIRDSIEYYQNVIKTKVERFRNKEPYENIINDIKVQEGIQQQDKTQQDIFNQNMMNGYYPQQNGDMMYMGGVMGNFMGNYGYGMGYNDYGYGMGMGMGMGMGNYWINYNMLSQFQNKKKTIKVNASKQQEFIDNYEKIAEYGDRITELNRKLENENDEDQRNRYNEAIFKLNKEIEKLEKKNLKIENEFKDTLFETTIIKQLNKQLSSLDINAMDIIEYEKLKFFFKDILNFNEKDIDICNKNIYICFNEVYKQAKAFIEKEKSKYNIIISKYIELIERSPYDYNDSNFIPYLNYIKRKILLSQDMFIDSLEDIKTLDIQKVKKDVLDEKNNEPIQIDFNFNIFSINELQKIPPYKFANFNVTLLSKLSMEKLSAITQDQFQYISVNTLTQMGEKTNDIINGNKNRNEILNDLARRANGELLNILNSENLTEVYKRNPKRIANEASTDDLKRIEWYNFDDDNEKKQFLKVTNYNLNQNDIENLLKKDKYNEELFNRIDIESIEKINFIDCLRNTVQSFLDNLEKNIKFLNYKQISLLISNNLNLKYANYINENTLKNLLLYHINTYQNVGGKIQQYDYYPKESLKNFYINLNENIKYINQNLLDKSFTNIILQDDKLLNTIDKSILNNILAKNEENLQGFYKQFVKHIIDNNINKYQNLYDMLDENNLRNLIKNNIVGIKSDTLKTILKLCNTELKFLIAYDNISNLEFAYIFIEECITDIELDLLFSKDSIVNWEKQGGEYVYTIAKILEIIYQKDKSRLRKYFTDVNNKKDIEKYILDNNSNNLLKNTIRYIYNEYNHNDNSQVTAFASKTHHSELNHTTPKVIITQSSPNLIENGEENGVKLGLIKQSQGTATSTTQNYPNLIENGINDFEKLSPKSTKQSSPKLIENTIEQQHLNDGIDRQFTIPDNDNIGRFQETIEKSHNSKQLDDYKNGISLSNKQHEHLEQINMKQQEELKIIYDSEINLPEEQKTVIKDVYQNGYPSSKEFYVKKLKGGQIPNERFNMQIDDDRMKKTLQKLNEYTNENYKDTITSWIDNFENKIEKKKNIEEKIKKNIDDIGKYNTEEDYNNDAFFLSKLKYIKSYLQDYNNIIDDLNKLSGKILKELKNMNFMKILDKYTYDELIEAISTKLNRSINKLYDAVKDNSNTINALISTYDRIYYHNYRQNSRDKYELKKMNQKLLNQIEDVNPDKNKYIKELNDNIDEVLDFLEDIQNSIGKKNKPAIAKVIDQKNNETKSVSMYEKIWNKYISDVNDNDKLLETSQDKLNQAYTSFNLDPQKALAVSRDDKIVFIIIAFIIRQISLSITEILIEKDIVTSFLYSLVSYFVVYTVIILIIILIINFDDYKLRIIFNYFNLHINGSGISGHILMVFGLIFILYYLIYMMTQDSTNEKKKILSDIEKIKLTYKMELLTIIVFAFVALTDLMVS